MCPPEAMMVLNIASTVLDYNSKKKQARAHEDANKQTSKNLNMAYHAELSQLESEKSTAAREYALETIKQALEEKALKAKALNLGYGNPIQLVRDIGGTAGLEWLDLENDFMSDMNTLINQQFNSYATLQRGYNRLTPVVYPDPTASLLQAGASVGSYLSVPASDRRFMKGFGTGAINPTAAESYNQDKFKWDIEAQRTLKGNY
tara:strand:- start:1219 stop:1830 length:612 start_codon:yes stop_codon:yes gene_type:complete